MVLQSSPNDPDLDLASPTSATGVPRMPDLQALSPARVHTRISVQPSTLSRATSSPKRGDSSIPPVPKFRPSGQFGTVNDFGTWLRRFETWVQTKTGTEDPRRWQPVALSQLPLLIDDKFTDSFYNRLRKNPEWGYPQITEALKRDWRGPNKLSRLIRLEQTRFDPTKENFWDFSLRLRTAFFAAADNDPTEDDPTLVYLTLCRAPKAARAAASANFRLVEGEYSQDVRFYDVAQYIYDFCEDHPETCGHRHSQAPPHPAATTPQRTDEPAHPVSAATAQQGSPLSSPAPPARPEQICHSCNGRGHINPTYSSGRGRQRSTRYGGQQPYGPRRGRYSGRAAESRRNRRLKGNIHKLQRRLNVATATLPHSDRHHGNMENEQLAALGKLLTEAVQSYQSKNV